MLAKEMHDFRDLLSDRGITFCYSGYITEDILVGIGKVIKQKMAMDVEDTKTSKAVFTIFVEQVQNVIRYSADTEITEDKTELRYGILAVGRKEGTVFVTCGNTIAKKDSERLEKLLTSIQQMDKKELKELWKETLRGETPEGSKGAGVGFITIARRTTKGFDFDIMDVDDDHSFFTIKAKI